MSAEGGQRGLPARLAQRVTAVLLGSLWASAVAAGCDTADRPGTDGSRAAARSERPAGSTTKAESPIIRVVMGKWMTFAPLHIARARGFFTDQGLDVEFVVSPSTASSIPLLQRGEIDVLPGPLTPAFFNAVRRGARLGLVANKGFMDPEGCAFTGLVVRPGFLEELEEAVAVRPGATRTDAADRSVAGGTLSPAAVPELRVRGRRPRMSLSLEPQFRYFATRALALHGLMLADFETVHVPKAAEIRAFQDGTLDAALMEDPGITQAREIAGAEMWLSQTDVIPGFEHALIAYGPRLIEEAPELGRRFMVGYLAGVRAYNEGKTEENVSTLSKATGYDPELLRAICWPPIRRDGRIDLASLETYRTWYVEAGLLDPGSLAADLWDPSFIEHANRVLSHQEEGR